MEKGVIPETDIHIHTLTSKVQGKVLSRERGEGGMNTMDDVGGEIME